VREEGVRRGRPRDETRDEAIRTAVVELLGEVGYSALTVDAVATRARAGKATIYRRWPGKSVLVVDAVSGLAAAAIPEPDTGGVRGDLVAFLSAFAAALRGPLGGVATAVLGELAHNPDLAAAMRTALWQRVRAGTARVLRRGVERGQVRPDAPQDLVAELAGAALLHRLVLTGEPVDDAFVETLVDGALAPLLLGSTDPVG
jgi:AcrR family transcriptional regulator